MPDAPTFSDLYKAKAKAITDEQVDATAAVYLAGYGTSADLGGRWLEVAAAVEAHAPSRTAMANGATTPAFRRTMVRTAILLARPQ